MSLMLQNPFVVTILLCVLSSKVCCQSVTSTLPVEPVCPGENVTFTCETRGSPIIAWRSDEYIEGGGTQLEFGTVNSIGNTAQSPRYPTTVATLTDNRLDGSVAVLISTLQITISSDFPNPSVTCIHIGNGTINETRFQAMVPGETPNNITSDERSQPVGPNGTGCVVHLSWNPPNNIAPSDIMHYMIFINGENSFNETSNVNSNLTITAYSLCDCGNHTISISSVNRCGHVGQSTPTVTLYPIPKELPAVIITNNCGMDGDSTTLTASTPTSPMPCECPCTDEFAALIVVIVLFVVVAIVLIVALVLVSWYCSSKNDYSVGGEKEPKSENTIEMDVKS